MVKRPDDETVKLLAKKVEFIKEKYAPERLLLFGSRARGDHLRDSDIDLLVVSSKFRGVEWRKRIIDIFGHWDKKQMLEPICLTPEEFTKKRKQIGIIKQAVKEGIELKNMRFN